MVICGKHFLKSGRGSCPVRSYQRVKFVAMTFHAEYDRGKRLVHQFLLALLACGHFMSPSCSKSRPEARLALLSSCDNGFNVTASG